MQPIIKFATLIKECLSNMVLFEFASRVTHRRQFLIGR